MKSHRFVFALVLTLLLLAVGAVTGLAQTKQPTDDEVNAVAKELYCPVCENIPLDVCPTQACAQWRDLIREKLAAGWNKDQIKNYFRDQYGNRVLGQPPMEGFNWLVYILPPVFFLVGLYLVFRALSHRRRFTSAVPGGGAPPAKEDIYLKRIEDELKNRN